MQTYAEMQSEIEKLNKSQRDSARTVTAARLTSVKVVQLGCKTIVKCSTDDFAYRIAMGPRGKIWDVRTHEKANGAAAYWEKYAA